jgi:endonuclease/exonuclease/phosphatase family metal-dependent hydrolase
MISFTAWKLSVRHLLLLAILAAGAAGGGYFFQHYRLEGLENVRIVPKAENGKAATGPLWSPAAADDPAEDEAPAPLGTTQETIRVASFNIQVFGSSKSEKVHVMETLARITRQFDVVAVQEIRSRSQDILPRFVELINSADRHYDYVIGPRLGRTSSKEQYAFVFDRATVEVDRVNMYTVADPDDLLHRPPLVAAFRVRGPPPDKAFTFTLINVHTDPDEVDQELNVLDDVFRLVQNDGRAEDDVIMLGDFNADDQHLGELGQLTSLTCAIIGRSTNTRGTRQYDNLVFSDQATTEFTGRAGVLDFMRQYNLSMEQALEVSDHLPVWAEFSVREGRQAGRVARRLR